MLIFLDVANIQFIKLLYLTINFMWRKEVKLNCNIYTFLNIKNENFYANEIKSGYKEVSYYKSYMVFSIQVC